MTLRTLPAPHIDAPGLYYDVPDELYHADPVTGLSLSSSVAKLLVSKSPRHAWYAHPRLNKSLLMEPEDSTPAKDFGTAVHTIALGQGRPIKEVPFDDFRKGAAQEMRDAARAAGQVPLLSRRLQAARTVAEALRDQLATTEFGALLDKGRAEVTGVWNDVEDVRCRMRVDWLPEAALAGGHITALDLKTTGESAAPEEWHRHAFDMGYDIQDELYRRGLKELIPGTRSVRFVFIAIEQDAPHGLTIHEFGGHARAEAEQLLDMAMALWSACLDRDKWPGYSAEPSHIDPPKWRSERGMFRKMAMQTLVERFFKPLARGPGPA